MYLYIMSLKKNIANNFSLNLFLITLTVTEDILTTWECIIIYTYVVLE